MPPTPPPNRLSLRAVYYRFRIRNAILREFLGELAGTMTLLIFGCGVLAEHILGDKTRLKYGSLISVTLGWGLAICMGVFVSGRSGKGHINPAISLAMAVTGRLQWRRLPVYMAAQYIGAFLGGLIVYSVYAEHIQRAEFNTTDSVYSMSLTGPIFVTTKHASVGVLTCFWDQVLGTALLASGALAIVDPNNFNAPPWSHPLLVGFLFFAIVSGFALNAGGALNPARDFAPRVMLSLFGWGISAFEYENYYFWVPLVAPNVGAILGAIGYDLLIGNHLEPLPEVVARSDIGTGRCFHPQIDLEDENKFHQQEYCLRASSGVGRRADDETS